MFAVLLKIRLTLVALFVNPAQRWRDGSRKVPAVVVGGGSWPGRGATRRDLSSCRSWTRRLAHAVRAHYSVSDGFMV
jgi:hypothetical protein